MFTAEALAERFNNFPFSDSAVSVFNAAEAEVRRFKHNYIGTEHLLLGLINEEVPALKALGVNLSNVRSSVEFIIGRGERTVEGAIVFTPRANTVIELGILEAKRLGNRTLLRDHILLGLVIEGEGIAAGIFESLGVVPEKLRDRALADFFGGTRIIQALDDLDYMKFFLQDPDQDITKREQLGIVLKGIRADFSTKSKPIV